MNMIDPQKKYTYRDYLSWDDNERWELIDGAPYLMTAPLKKHQDIVGNVFTAFKNYLRGKTCRAYVSPFDVRFSDDEETDVVVQPDVTIYCDSNKTDRRGGIGTPDLVVEVLSDSTARKDRWEKYKLYERHGVQEYWVIDPNFEVIEVYHLKNGHYRPQGAYGRDETLSVGIFEGFTIQVNELFEE